MKDNENTTETAVAVIETLSNEDGSGTTQLTGWKTVSETLNEDISRSMSLIDSTALGLHSYMRGMFKDEPDPGIKHYEVDKVQTAVVCAREINALIKTKLQAIKDYKNLMGYDGGPKEVTKE